jgi:hypothetical protein
MRADKLDPEGCRWLVWTLTDDRPSAKLGVFMSLVPKGEQTGMTQYPNDLKIYPTYAMVTTRFDLVDSGQVPPPDVVHIPPRGQPPETTL